MTAILFAFLVGISEICRTNDTVTTCDTYALAVQAAGCDAVVIPRTTDTNSLRRVVRALDLVIFTGGEDVEPWRYGATPSPRLGGTNAGRDAYDFALFEACKLEDKPILGICRGCQALNVAFGGTLVQDIPTEHTPPTGRTRCVHCKYPYAGGRTNPPLHEVSFVAGTRLAKMLGSEPMKVNSHHHQAVKDVAPGFRVAAQSPDGVIEAIEHETRPIYGIQFHPELTVARRPRTGFDIPRHLELFKRLPELAKRPVQWSYPCRAPNYDKAKIAPYTLEDPLTFKDGRKVASAADWERRRAELLEIFAHEMYGVEPPKPEAVVTELADEKAVLHGKAVRRQYRMWFRRDRSGPCVNWIAWTPADAKAAPVILYLNYHGNHELVPDEDVILHTGWIRNRESSFVTEHKASEKGRGLLYGLKGDTCFPLDTIIDRGYAVMSATYCEVSPDPNWDEPEPCSQAKFAYTGVFSLWGPRDPSRGDNPTAIGAWAWALSRGLDLAERIPGIDAKKSVVTGCSRLGKSALLAAARDSRFAVCVVNQAGGGGVCLAKRDYGESVATEMVMFTHWYCRNYGKYAEDPAKTLTFDQHLLLASIAPRPVLVQGFTTSPWMDPEGEFLACKAAAPVWKFLGKDTMPDVPYPAPYDTAAIGGSLGFVLRDGQHGIAPSDWIWTLDFADKGLR